MLNSFEKTKMNRASIVIALMGHSPAMLFDTKLTRSVIFFSNFGDHQKLVGKAALNFSD